ncbi:MAG: DUF86 domain-containing protein [Nitrospiraceae bacterium]|nr:MAG: DUF86 domain-containing protein [Nitrospiraceae bacterium]
MRDVLIHDYMSVDVETVWLTAKVKIPPIKSLLNKFSRGLDERY